MILTETGVLKLMQRIKSFITSQLNTKANSVHTHTLSEIDDLSNLSMGGGYTKSEVDTLLTGKADTGHTHTKSQITDFPSYGTTANTICEGNDSRLSDARTPTSHTHTKSEITDFPTLATVATSGSYNDLSNKPTIPTVNNATLTIQKNGTTIDTFTANSSTDKTVNIQCVDLTNNQTVGGIKTFSNAPVVGSINLDGKTIDTDVNGNMTYDGHIIDTIEEQGNGYIRYSNGLQICWTYNELVTQSSSGTWTYPKTFISIPCIWWQATGNNTVYIDAVNSGDRTPSNAVFIPSRYMNGSVVAAPYGVEGLAIGRWK